ncbi:hypothetical protein [Flavobacterium sp. SORGH_AS_0622]|jgi:hypothetical protein|uniref:hypothetical protein n=1 Tax=Flavobacterium sp. SORGH_AS_0622 TaxID=3041772 RepID=UPI00278839AF|nr:hypothetical protein [Flavobacterium sp. SORGH_AS_0622]MDQ1164599.1 hypothetical protein [Flavobacterium sp. SORGH_AS_0622]
MSTTKTNLKPQDIVILLKIIALENREWFQDTLALELYMSQSEISQSLNRCKYALLIDSSKKKVNRMAFTEFLFYGLRYVFPQQPGPVVRGIATAHSAAPINEHINADEVYVWPYARGNIRGQAIEPLYPTVVDAALRDFAFYELASLVDSLRVGRTREREIAKEELRKRIL